GPGPVPAVEGPRPGRVLRGAGGQGIRARVLASRFRRRGLAAGVPPRPQPRTRRRDRQRVAGPWTAAGRRPRARAAGPGPDQAAGLRAGRRRRTGRGQQQRGHRVRRRGGPAEPHGGRRRHQIEQLWVGTRRNRFAFRRQRLVSDPRERPRPRRFAFRAERRCWPASARRGNRGIQGAIVMTDMRTTFASAAEDLLDTDPLSAVVLAEISADLFAKALARHPERVLNVGIREQLMMSVAGGLALAGLRPIVHTYAPFLDTLPGFAIPVPGHPHEVPGLLAAAMADLFGPNGQSSYLRLSVTANKE